MENGTATLEITTAITDDDLDVVKSWLGSGGDPNAMCSGSHEWSLLRWAASYGKPEIMSLLLSRGADVDATDPEGRTAVYQLLNHWGQHRSLPALRVLLSHGADVNLAKTARTLFAGRSPRALAPILSIAPQGMTVIRRKKFIENKRQADVCSAKVRTPKGAPIC